MAETRPADAAAPPAGRSMVLGSLLVVLASIGYGLTPVFARLAYDRGSTSLTVLVVRSAVAALLLAVGLRALGRPLLIPRRALIDGLGVGLGFTGMSFGYMAAIEFIPVSLAVLIFFGYPLLVAGLAALAGTVRLGWDKRLALLAAFGGLALVLGVSAEGLDLRGVGLSVGGAFGCAAMYLLSGRAMRRGADPLALTLLSVLVAAAITLPAALITGGWAIPDNAPVALALAGVLGCFLVGIGCFFTAVELIGPVRVAMLSNLEPLVSLGAAVLVLGEALTAVQLAGVALVLGSVVVMSRA